jgi:hypothetical protein
MPCKPQQSACSQQSRRLADFICNVCWPSVYRYNYTCQRPGSTQRDGTTSRHVAHGTTSTLFSLAKTTCTNTVLLGDGSLVAALSVLLAAELRPYHQRIEAHFRRVCNPPLTDQQGHAVDRTFCPQLSDRNSIVTLVVRSLQGILTAHTLGGRTSFGATSGNPRLAYGGCQPAAGACGYHRGVASAMASRMVMAHSQLSSTVPPRSVRRRVRG